MDPEHSIQTGALRGLSDTSRVNGHTPATSPVAIKHQKERQRLFDSISASGNRRRTIQFDDPQPDDKFMRAQPPASDEEVVIEEPGRDPRDQAPSGPARVPGIDFDGLSWPSVGTRARLEASPEQAKATLEKMTGHIKGLLECLGEDTQREGLLETPERYAKAMMYFTKGYEENLRDVVNGAVFHEDHDEMVIVRDIDVFSLCEHHLVPFTGKVCPVEHSARQMRKYLPSCDQDGSRVHDGCSVLPFLRMVDWSADHVHAIGSFPEHYCRSYNRRQRKKDLARRGRC